jgi:hypothetical protein
MFSFCVLESSYRGDREGAGPCFAPRLDDGGDANERAVGRSLLAFLFFAKTRQRGKNKGRRAVQTKLDLGNAATANQTTLFFFSANKNTRLRTTGNVTLFAHGGELHFLDAGIVFELETFGAHLFDGLFLLIGGAIGRATAARKKN